MGGCQSKASDQVAGAALPAAPAKPIEKTVENSQTREVPKVEQAVPKGNSELSSI